MEQIRNTVNAVIRLLETGRLASGEVKIEELLKKLLTKKELKHIKLHYFKKGILGIKVDSSSWLYQLSLEKEGLLKELQQGLAEIKDIRFSLGEINDNGKRKSKTGK
ncbi:MAG: DciA family protein [Candidatus Omnitrophota bacterium]